MEEKYTTWRGILGDFLKVCEDSGAQEQPERIQEAATLFAFIKNMPPQVVAKVKGLVAAEAYESAAVALLKPETSFAIRRGSDGGYSASIAFAGATEETSTEGKTLALALLKAKTLALLST